MKRLCLLIFCLILIQSVFGQDTRKLLTAEEVKLIKSLKDDDKFVRVSCQFFREEFMKKSDIDNRLLAFRSLQNKNKKFKIKRACGTREGDPIYAYLIVENGIASIIIDTSEDEFGSKQVYSYKCESLKIGKYHYDKQKEEMVFKKIEDKKLNEQKFILMCANEKSKLPFTYFII